MTRDEAIDMLNMFQYRGATWVLAGYDCISARINYDSHGIGGFSVQFTEFEAIAIAEKIVAEAQNPNSQWE